MPLCLQVGVEATGAYLGQQVRRARLLSSAGENLNFSQTPKCSSLIYIPLRTLGTK